MNCKKTFRAVAMLAATFFVISGSKAQTGSSVGLYQWRSVQMSGAGFVSGIVFHPKKKGLRYCCTDMGGAYRWDDSLKSWTPLLDWIPIDDVNLMGIEALAVDPNNANLLYLACGTYTNPMAPNGAILCSNDRGRTFMRVDVPFKMGGNEIGRGNGERMVVDPNNSNIIYLGTREDGLWRSVDQGVSWNPVLSFPVVKENPPADLKNEDYWRWAMRNKGAGIVSVVFDKKSNQPGEGSQIIYIAVSLKERENFFRSTDGGETWKAVPGAPQQYRPNRVVMASDGDVYITYGDTPGPFGMTSGGLWKFIPRTGEWKEISPEKPSTEKPFGYASVAVEATNPNVLLTSTFFYPGGEEIFRSLDGGQTWNGIMHTATYDYSLAPYTSHTGIHWLFGLEIDPFDANHALFTTGYGGHETFNLLDADSSKSVRWQAMSRGIEESVALDLLSPPQGAHLISAIGDYGGFVHWDLDKPAPEGNFDKPHFGNTNGVACAENNPALIVRVGVESRTRNGKNIAFSTDYGHTWHATQTKPKEDSRLGFISISSDGHTWVWTPDRSNTYATCDSGHTWIAVKGLPDNTRVISDKVNPARFYAIDLFNGKFFESNDSAKNFRELALNLPGGYPKSNKERGDRRGGLDRIYATPGIEGDIWLAAFDGLYHSVDGGWNFEKMWGVEQIHAFGFGKASPDSDYPAMYLVGTILGTRGIFRSTNESQDWVRINDDQHQWGLILQITGDPKKFGRVYVGTHGRGTIYGDPLK
jgi:photosystem II stability/assembly factor-like uncharacterized protein